MRTSPNLYRIFIYVEVKSPAKTVSLVFPIIPGGGKTIENSTFSILGTYFSI